MDLDNDIIKKASKLLAKIESQINDQNDSEINDNENTDTQDIPEIIKRSLETDSNLSFKPNTSNDDLVKEKCEVSIIQAFYGTNSDRITATTRALNSMLNSNPQPSEWIFVEAQTNSEHAVFKWLKSYGVKYIFKKIESESIGLSLKTALWNIGATYATTDNLCFIDSDIAFCNDTWIQSVSDGFSLYDVMSLAGYCYYENNDNKNNIIESIGHIINRTDGKNINGHIGFNIGMTRTAYERYGHFEAFNFHDDVWIWQKILGTNIKPDKIGWSPYNTVDNEQMKYGLPFTIGSTEEVCCHLEHDYTQQRKYEMYGIVSYFGTNKPFEDITYDPHGKNLPKWNNNLVGKTIRYAFNLINDFNDDIESTDILDKSKEILKSARMNICGEIDEKHPLFIMTGFSSDFNHKSFQTVIDFKLKLEQMCNQPFTLVCFTDDDTDDSQVYGIDTILFSSKEVKNDRRRWKEEMNRSEINFPSDATITWIDIDCQIDQPFDIARFQKEVLV